MDEKSRSRPRAHDMEVRIDHPESSRRGEQRGRKRKTIVVVTTVEQGHGLINPEDF